MSSNSNATQTAPHAIENSLLETADRADRAKRALERVCSGAGLDAAETYYCETFVDHVNDREFRGLAGIEKSVALYRRVLSQLSIEVQQQVAQGDSVASRFVVRGVSFGRSVRFDGITVSRFANGRIVEDWSVTDTLGMLRQLGLVRAVLVALKSVLHVPARTRGDSRERGVDGS